MFSISKKNFLDIVNLLNTYALFKNLSLSLSRCTKIRFDLV